MQRIVTSVVIVAILLGASGVSHAKWIWQENKWVYIEDAEPPLPLPQVPNSAIMGPGIAPVPAPTPTSPGPIPAPAARVNFEPAPAAPVAAPAIPAEASAAEQAIQEAKWAEAVKSASGDEANLYNQGRAEIADGHFADGAKSLLHLIDKFPQSSLCEEAMWLRSAALLATGDHYATFEQLEELISHYAGSPHYREALVKEIKIAEAFLGGVHRKIWGMTSPFSAESEGLEILRKVYEHQPRGELAEGVVMRVADYYWANRDWPAAEDYYDKYCREFPNGPLVRRAELLRAKCTIESCRGPRYDTSGLQLALDRLNQFQKKYPEEARQENVAALIDGVRDMQAQGLYETAAQYQRAGKPQAAAHYAEKLRDQFPDSVWSERAAPMLAARPAKEEPKP